MNGKALWQLGGFLAVVAILAFAWFVLISPTLDGISANTTQRETVDAQNHRIETEIAALSKVDQDALRSSLAARIAQVPETLVEEDVFREIQALGDATGVEVSSISIGQPTALAITQASAEGEQAATPAPGDPIVSPGLPIKDADLQAASAAGMYQSSVSLTIDGSFDAARAFVDRLSKQSTRTFLVSEVSFNADGGSQSVSSTIWFKPRAEDLLSDPTPAPTPAG